MHDAVYKALYSLPETIEALVRVVAPRLAADMDFARLARLSTDYATAGQRSRYGDMLWECRLRDGTAVLVVVEFQSDVDHTMPLRLLQYTGSAWLEWVRARKRVAGTGIPLVLPVLIYSGRDHWKVPTSLKAILPAARARWLAVQPGYEYLLLEERRGGTRELPEDNLVGELMAVARARDKEMIRAVALLRDRMRGREGGSLDRAVAGWLKSVITDLEPRLAAGVEAATTTMEVMEVIKPKGKWSVRWYEDGRVEGVERQLRRLVALKFGDDAVGRLAEILSPFPDSDVVDAVFDAAFDAVLDCDGADEFFARIAGGRMSATPAPEG